jgi:hypothetical protein
MYEPSQAVLPPRPTSPAYPAEPRGSRWRSWPVVVIVLAMVAIVVAVVLMVWPASRRDLDGKHTTGSPPAPQRMQTAPEIAIPPLSPNAHPRVAPPTPDPWSPRQHDPAAAAPSPQSVDPATGDDVDDPGADTLDDLGGSQSPPPPAAAQDRRRPRANGSGLMYLAMVEHMCLKIHQCGADSAAVGAMCDKLSHHEPPANCPAAERCLEQIDTISCGAQSGDLVQLQEMMTQLSDCADAVRC